MLKILECLPYFPTYKYTIGNDNFLKHSMPSFENSIDLDQLASGEES